MSDINPRDIPDGDGNVFGKEPDWPLPPDEELRDTRTESEILEIKMELAEREPDALYAALHEARDLTDQFDEATSKLAWAAA